MFNQILLRKSRLPLEETKIFSLNIDCLSRNIPSLHLALIRGEEVFDMVAIQETKASGFQIACYTSYESEKCFSLNSKIKGQIHGVGTFICNITSNNGISMISKHLENLDDYQRKDMKINISSNKNPISAVLTEYKKIQIIKSDNIVLFNSPDNLNFKESMDMSLNLYLPNRSSHHSTLNSDICKVLLPRLFDKFKNLNVFSDSNADNNQLYTIKNGNE